jgi:hypothetical protein
MVLNESEEEKVLFKSQQFLEPGDFYFAAAMFVKNDTCNILYDYTAWEERKAYLWVLKYAQTASRLPNTLQREITMFL